jgi:hypothetical protein
MKQDFCLKNIPYECRVKDEILVLIELLFSPMDLASYAYIYLKEEGESEYPVIIRNMHGWKQKPTKVKNSVVQ